MLKIKSCTFIGHRKIKITEELKTRLKETIEDLIIMHNVLIFLFGSRSEFNDLCHSIVTEMKEKYPKLIRIAYTCKSETCVLEKDKERFKEIYSNLQIRDNLLCFEEEIEHKNKYRAGRASYVERNQAMIDDSDFCIFYYDENYAPDLKRYSGRSLASYQPQSGTKLAYNYAKFKKKKTINILNLDV